LNFEILRQMARGLELRTQESLERPRKLENFGRSDRSQTAPSVSEEFCVKCVADL